MAEENYSTQRGETDNAIKKRWRTKQILLYAMTFFVVGSAVLLATSLSIYCFKRIFGAEDGGNHANRRSSTAFEQVYTRGAVAADLELCSIIGRDILKENGSAVDAAIASILCLGVTNMHSSGIGGGGVMVVYTKSSGTVETFDFRERAPGKAREEMFLNSSSNSKYGALSIAVPGEVKGMYEVHQLYGRLPWKRLFQPSIELTRDGFPVHKRLFEAARSYKECISKDPGLRDLLMENGKVVQIGVILKNPLLSRTLEEIANSPLDFYHGSLAENMAKDIRDNGGIVSVEDLNNYEVHKRPNFVLNLGNLVLYTTPPPFGGEVVGYILNILKGYNFQPLDLKDRKKSALVFHRFTEAFKFSFAKKTRLGDPDFMDKDYILGLVNDMANPDEGEAVRRKISDNSTHNVSYYEPEYSDIQDHGTTHVSVISENGDAVSFTSSINEWFGSCVRSLSTGVIFNNQMDDFSTPGLVNLFGLSASPANYIHSRKTPMSSMSPSIIMDDSGKVRMVVGASGGTRIIPAVSQVIMFKFWFNLSLSEAVSFPRIYHQLTPNRLVIESSFCLSERMQSQLEDFGHKIWVTVRPEYSSVQALYVDDDGGIHAKSDPRKYGVAAGL